MSKSKIMMAFVLLLFSIASIGLAFPIGPPNANTSDNFLPNASWPALQEKAPIAFDLHGDPLPQGALARLGTVRLHHEGGSKVVSSGDGKILASEGNGIVKLWDAASGRQLKQFPGNRGFALSQDGKRFASPGPLDPDRLLVRIWDTDTGKELHQLSGHRNEIFAIAFSPNGKLLATGGLDGTLRLWDAVAGKQVALLTEQKDLIHSLAFAPDGRTLISGEKDLTRVWEIASHKERQRFPDKQLVALSPDGRIIAMTSENGRILHLVQFPSGRVSLTFKDFPTIAKTSIPRVINSASIAPDGKILATICNQDPAVRVWDVNNGKLLRTIPLAYDASSAVFTHGGTSLAVGVAWDFPCSRIRLFDTATGTERELQPGHQAATQSLSFLPAGKGVASIGFDNTFRLWQAADGKLVRTLALTKLPRAMSQDGSLVATSGQGGAHGPSEDSLELWDTATGKLWRKLEGHAGSVNLATFTADGATLAVATSSGDDLFLWDVKSGKLKQRWQGPSNNHRPATLTMAFSPDGKMLATAHRDCTVHLWDADAGQFLRALGKPFDTKGDRHFNGISSITFAPNGKLVAAAVYQENVIYVWETVSGKQVQRITNLPANFGPITFSPDGKTLVCGGTDGIRLWEMTTGNERLSLQGHRGAVGALAVSSDGKRLASGSYDCTILIWDLSR